MKLITISIAVALLSLSPALYSESLMQGQERDKPHLERDRQRVQAAADDACAQCRTLRAQQQALEQEIHQKKQEFISAVRTNRPDDVRRLLTEGLDVRGLRYYNSPLLGVAVGTGNPELVQILLDNGADPNENNVLIQYAGTPHVEAFRRLIAAGANIDATNEFRNTALIVAANSKNTAIAKMLIDAGVNVNIVGDRNQTALIHAIGNNNVELVRYLLEHGADPRLGNQQLIQQTLRNPGFEAIQQLLEEFRR